MNGLDPLTALLTAGGSVLVALIAVWAKRLEAKSGSESTGLTTGATLLEAAVREWMAVATEAKSNAATATSHAQAAEQRAAAAETEARNAGAEAGRSADEAQKARRDAHSLVAYTRAMWAGILAGTVPPAPPVPDHLTHLLDPDDFPWPKGTPTAD
jgi:hypothetical protein